MTQVLVIASGVVLSVVVVPDAKLLSRCGPVCANPLAALHHPGGADARTGGAMPGLDA
jgi:hypothetical protein